jgi:leucyl aminopeptidase
MPHTKSQNQVLALFDDELDALKLSLDPETIKFFDARRFEAKVGSFVTLPHSHGLQAWFGLGNRDSFSPMIFLSLSTHLTKGEWTLSFDKSLKAFDIYLAIGLGNYRFTRYKSDDQTTHQQVTITPSGSSSSLGEDQILHLNLALSAHDLIRDLINTPPNDMGPHEIEDAARAVAKAAKAQIKVITGEGLLAQNYPAIHAVGRAAVTHRAPRFIEIEWQAEPKGDVTDLPVVVLIGKGVAFDTGGLNIKGGAGMALMKKDMGGAAHVLGLAQWIMAAKLPIKLFVLIAAVENAISGDAFRPSDILSSRSGLSIEVGNTDAEGRLILADALTRASELGPDLTLDFATLTGAARVALGPEIVPFYTDNEDIALKLHEAALNSYDPLWRMPLWAGYRPALDSDIADIRNDPQAWAQAGSVTAALFLQRFAPKSGAWVHFDIYGWNPKSQTGKPVGAEVQAIRAVFNLIKNLKP